LEANLAENQLTEIEEARAFAQAIIDTVREPILVLDQDLRVITASRSFYRTFKVGPEGTTVSVTHATFFWQRCPVACERREASIEQQTKILHARADEVR